MFRIPFSCLTEEKVVKQAVKFLRVCKICMILPVRFHQW